MDHSMGLLNNFFAAFDSVLSLSALSSRNLKTSGVHTLSNQTSDSSKWLNQVALKGSLHQLQNKITVSSSLNRTLQIKYASLTFRWLGRNKTFCKFTDSNFQKHDKKTYKSYVGQDTQFLMLIRKNLLCNDVSSFDNRFNSTLLNCGWFLKA